MRKNVGFTVIEIMIVLVIIGILAAIAIPNYNDYVKKSRISRAVAELSDMRVKMELYFQDNRTYVGACVTGTVAPLPIDPAVLATLPANQKPDFVVSCPAGNLTSTGYIVRADGDDVNASGKMSGFRYEINQSNVKTTTLSSAAGKASVGWSGSGSNCWVLNKTGGC